MNAFIQLILYFFGPFFLFFRTWHDIICPRCTFLYQNAANKQFYGPFIRLSVVACGSS